MQNPWKLTTFLLGGALLISSAHAESDWKAGAITHLEKASAILAEHGGSKTGKTVPGEGSKSRAETSPVSKALQLTRAAIVQLRREE